MKNLDSRMALGFCVLLVLAVLAIVIALGKVEQQTSAGLNIVLGALAVLSGQFSQWAFSGKNDKKDE
jgi:hypothetical protein